jgi:uncharacterized protein (DUF2062 family)
MMIFTRFKEYLKKQFSREQSPHKLALSLSFAIFIAFSPFLLLHTVLVFVCSWLFRLNFAITFAVVHMIHNPWATIPIYASDYMLGDLLLHKWLGLNTLALNPTWMGFFNGYITKYVGLTDISLVAFLVGGNLLGLILAISLYPLMKSLCARYMIKPSLPSA